MPALIAALRVGMTWLGRAGIAIWAVDTAFKLTQKDEAYVLQSTEEAKAAGVSEQDYAKLVAGTKYDQIEQEGGSPDDFWAGLPEGAKEKLQFSPESLRQDIGRTKFLGLTSALMFAAALTAGGVAAFRGIPITLKTLASLAAARKANATAATMANIFNEGRIAGLAKVWVPGFLAGIATAAGWLSASMVNNLNDATLWGRIFLGQAADDFEKQQDKLKQVEAGGSVGGSAPLQAKTIIKIVEEKKPEQFIGTLFSSKLGKLEDFNRHVDDEITSEADLIADVKINLNRWLASLPGRMGYSVVIRKDPVDSSGVKQSGNWVTLTTHFTRLSGPIQPIDTILLGPVSPVTRLKLSKVIKTIENTIPGILTGQEIRQVEIPNGSVDIFDTDGERVDLSQPRVKNTKSSSLPQATPQPLATNNALPPETAIPKLKTPAELLQLAKDNPPAPIEGFVNTGSTFVERDGFHGTIYKVAGGELLTYDAVNDLVSAAERQANPGFGQHIGMAQSRLSERGVDVAKLNKAAFIADVVSKYRDKRRAIQTFAEFFGRN